MPAAKSFEELVAMRNALMLDQKELYVATIANINMRYRELLKNDFGTTLVKNCAWDVADTLAARYFKTSDYYISPQQLYERIVHFSYDDEDDLLNTDAAIRKMISESQNGKEIVQDIFDKSCEAGTTLFTEARKKDPLEKKTIEYRKMRTANNDLTDDITGRKGSYYVRIKNGKEEQVSNLHADHIQARDSAKVDVRYVKKENYQDLKSFYYSEDNFWMIHASANTSKGAVRVCNTDAGTVFMSDKKFKDAVQAGILTEQNDITWKATPEQMADATIQMWEKETPSGNKAEKLQAEGYLDESGHAYPETKDKLVEAYKHSMDTESLLLLLPYCEEDETGKVRLRSRLDYKAIADDAFGYTKKAVNKIMVGQAIYYVLPPLVFETQKLVQRKGMTVDRFIDEIKKSGKRVIKYVYSRLGQIFKNIVGNGFNNFLKTFFDIVIEAVKATVKKALKIVKQLVLSLVNCVSILTRKSTGAEKADAVTKTLSVTISTVVLEVLFEWAEKQFNLPDMLMEPLQIIVTIITTNLVMLILQKADLFDVQYGLLVSNIDAVFAEEYEQYKAQFAEMTSSAEEQMQMHYEMLKQQIEEIEQSISSIDLFEGDVTDCLNEINIKYNMGIDFEHEWQTFILGT